MMNERLSPFANCCATFEHGQTEAIDIMEQIKNFKCIDEGIASGAIIKLKSYE